MEYTVKEGDSLSIIARDVLRDMSRWPEIAELNNVKAPFTIFPGQTLTLPSDEAPTTTDFYKGGAGKRGEVAPTASPAPGGGFLSTLNLPLISLAILGAALIWWGMKK